MSELITLSRPDHDLPRDLLDAAGGFAWWYLDLLDADGNGLVLIWSFGLPFLPGYASAARSGAAERPGDRPSVNVALYREGVLDCYLLQEYGVDDASWSADGCQWEIGDCRFHSRCADGRRLLDVHLDCPVPGTSERLIGEIRLDAPGRQAQGAEAADPGVDHDWTPLTGPAEGQASLRVGEQRYELRGRAYHDRNGGRVPLHDLDIEHWLWGRVPLPEADLIYYLLWPRGGGEPVCLGITIDADGATTVHRDLEVERIGARRGRAGLAYWDELRLSRGGEPWFHVKHERIVDDGPFYLRFHIRGRLHSAAQPDVSHDSDDSDGSDGYDGLLGFAEACRPDAVDADLLRPLVRMRVHRLDGGRNSMWLPLFTGPRAGRIGRLFRGWFADQRANGRANGPLKRGDGDEVGDELRSTGGRT